MKKIILFLIFISYLFISCTAKQKDNSVHIAVFVPGIASGSPVYEMLISGSQKAVDDYNNALPEKQKAKESVILTVVEAGTNQAEWSNQITALVSTQQFDLIISSNPSLPDLIIPLTTKFPNQKFIILDAHCEGNNSIKTVRYNQREQAWLSGYIAGLTTITTKREMPLSNSDKKIALVAAQEYPVMNEIILPSFIEGAKAADKEINVDFRLVGNWYDATKGAEIARVLYQSGVDVIMPICGGASQGIISTAQQLGFYISWFDDNGFDKAPGYIISSSAIMQDKLAYKTLSEYLNGNTTFGLAETVGIKDGYVDFVQNDPLYIQTVSPTIRKKLSDSFFDIQNGKFVLPMK